MIAQKLFAYITKKLLPIVEIENVLRVRQNKLIFEGRVLTPSEVQALQREVALFKNTKVWGILSNTLKKQAEQIIFEKSSNWQDVINGKMILYCIDTQENIIKQIEKA